MRWYLGLCTDLLAFTLAEENPGTHKLGYPLLKGPLSRHHKQAKKRALKSENKALKNISPFKGIDIVNKVKSLKWNFIEYFFERKCGVEPGLPN